MSPVSLLFSLAAIISSSGVICKARSDRPRRYVGKLKSERPRRREKPTYNTYTETQNTEWLGSIKEQLDQCKAEDPYSSVQSCRNRRACRNTGREINCAGTLTKNLLAQYKANNTETLPKDAEDLMSIMKETLPEMDTLNRTASKELQRLMMETVDGFRRGSGCRSRLVRTHKSEINEFVENVTKLLDADSEPIETEGIKMSVLSLSEQAVQLDPPFEIDPAHLPIMFEPGKSLAGAAVKIAVLGNDFTDLLPQPSDNSTNLSSPIISVNFQNQTLEKVEFSVIFNRPSNETGMERTCVFLDPEIADWATEGCTTSLMDGGQIRCSCNHTTSFAILLSATEISPEYMDGQEAMSYIMFGINVPFCVLTLIFLAPIENKKSKQLKTGQLSLLVALILANTGFSLLSGIVQIQLNSEQVAAMVDNLGCVSGAIVVQWLFLAALAWMSIISLIFYDKTVNAVRKYGNKGMVARWLQHLSAWCFTLLPPLVVAVAAFLSREKEGDYGKPFLATNECWPAAPWKYFSFFVPCWLLIFFNLFCFCAIGRVIVKTTSRRNRKDNLRLARSLFTLYVMVGLPWITAVFTFFETIAVYAQYFFIGSVGMQGPMMFVSLILLQDNVRQRYSSTLRRQNSRPIPQSDPDLPQDHKLDSLAPKSTTITNTSSSGAVQ